MEKIYQAQERGWFGVLNSQREEYCTSSQTELEVKYEARCIVDS